MIDNLRISGDAIGRHPAIGAISVSGESSASVSVEVPAQVAQNVVAELVDRLVAEHRLREPDATRLKPILSASGGFRAKDQKPHDSREGESEKAGEDAADDRFPVSVSHFREAFRP